jgi:hypothetical protein
MLPVFAAGFFAAGFLAGDGALLGSAEGDDDGVAEAGLAIGELVAITVPVCDGQDGSVAATTPPAPSTRIPPVSATATIFGLI